jgi:hypothetical protein
MPARGRRAPGEPSPAAVPAPLCSGATSSLLDVRRGHEFTACDGLCGPRAGWSSAAPIGGAVGRDRVVRHNDHVNDGQSTNDIVPTARHLVAGLEICVREAQLAGAADGLCLLCSTRRAQMGAQWVVAMP